MPSLADSLDAAEPPAGLDAPLQALWWLKKGGLAVGPGWERAHALCQAHEGEREADLVHGLAHLIEGDTANADYWYRRAGARRGADVAAEWDRLAAELGADPGADLGA
jgi:hypothetical protein